MNTRKYLYGAFFVLWVGNVCATSASYEALPPLKAPPTREPEVIYRALGKEHQSILGLTLLQDSFSDITLEIVDRRLASYAVSSTDTY